MQGSSDSKTNNATRPVTPRSDRVRNNVLGLIRTITQPGESFTAMEVAGKVYEIYLYPKPITNAALEALAARGELERDGNDFRLPTQH